MESFKACAGLKVVCVMPERTEDFALAECVEAFVGEAFERDAENDEADVAVFGARAGSGGKRGGEGGLQKVFASLGVQKKLLVGGQAGAVREQHAQRDFAADCIASEFGDDGGDRGFEIEQAALVEDHGHGGRGDDFGERSEIEEARGSHFGRCWIVGEASEDFVGDEFSAARHRERASRESACGNSFLDDVESAAKALILRGEIAHEEGKAGVSMR